ncbi:MAG TPA: sulfite exporter TauE/SafE family protein [Gemmatimonadaceae bacterium]|nr:sulfite exporter TauE/SafE family protein [Gemmatimonadaceae bacterium]
MIDATTLYVLAVILVATLIRSTFGFGEALVAVPLLALRIPIAVAAPVAVLVSVSVAALIVTQDWRHIEIRSASWLIVSALLGIPLGLLLLTTASDQIVRLLLGIVIVGFSLYSIGAHAKLHLETDHLAWLLGAGFCSGILGGAYGMNGPPLAMYGALRRWSPQRFRATLQGYFLAASLAGLAGYAAVGLWRPPVTRYFLLSLPCVLLGVAGGRWLNSRLSGDNFLRLVYAGLIVTGAVLIVQAITR